MLHYFVNLGFDFGWSTMTCSGKHGTSKPVQLTKMSLCSLKCTETYQKWFSVLP